jgi:hypothetical protein
LGHVVLYLVPNLSFSDRAYPVDLSRLGRGKRVSLLFWVKTAKYDRPEK